MFKFLCTIQKLYEYSMQYKTNVIKMVNRLKINKHQHLLTQRRSYIFIHSNQ